LKNYSKRRKHSRVDEEMNKGGPAAGEEVTGNNHIGGLGSMYLLPLAQVPKITRRICFKNTPWHAIVPPWCYHCFNTRGSTSTATTNTPGKTSAATTNTPGKTSAATTNTPGKTSAATTNNLDKTSTATTKQEYYHYHCNHCRNVFFLKPLEDIYHCIRS
jgi:hypothetical protein